MLDWQFFSCLLPHQTSTSLQSAFYSSLQTTLHSITAFSATALPHRDTATRARGCSRSSSYIDLANISFFQSRPHLFVITITFLRHHAANAANGKLNNVEHSLTYDAGTHSRRL